MSSGQDMGPGGLGMASSKSGDNNLISLIPELYFRFGEGNDVNFGVMSHFCDFPLNSCLFFINLR